MVAGESEKAAVGMCVRARAAGRPLQRRRIGQRRVDQGREGSLGLWGPGVGLCGQPPGGTIDPDLTLGGKPGPTHRETQALTAQARVYKAPRTFCSRSMQQGDDWSGHS